MDFDELTELFNYYRTQGDTLVATCGCFDLLHPGHIRLLQFAAEQGDYLLVGLNSDESVKTLKGVPRPIYGIRARLTLLEALACVDYITIIETPEELLDVVPIDIYVKGGQYENQPIVEGPIMEMKEGEVRFAPMDTRYSTTEIIRAIRWDYRAKLPRES